MRVLSQKVKLANVLSASGGGFLYPQIVFMMFLPFLVSVLLSIFGLWLTRDFWISYFSSGPLALQPYWIWLFEHAPEYLHSILNFFSMVAPWILFIVLFAMSFPIVVAVNLVVVSIMASTYLVKFIAQREYKDLKKQGRPRFLKGLWNAISASTVFLGMWIVTLPLWLIPGAALILPFLLTAWLNRRICSFDALTEFATDDELQDIQKRTQSLGIVLGLITAAINFFPMAFFISPVMTMVAFTHLNLQALALLRKENV